MNPGLILFAILMGVITILVYLVIKRYKYWERRNVPTGDLMPFFGDFYGLVHNIVSPAELFEYMYNKVPSDHRYVGLFFFHVPVLMPRTPDLIKQICVRDSDHFADHGNIIINSADDLWQKAVFPLKGQEWKDVRSMLSPILTGNKVKLMYPLINHQIENFLGFFKEQEEDIVEVDFKDCMLRVLNDITSDVALGIEVDSFRDRDNIVYKTGVSACNLCEPWKKVILLLYTLCQFIPKTLGLSLFPPRAREFFLNIVKDTMKKRKEEHLKRDDMIGLLIELRNAQLKASEEAGPKAKPQKVMTVQEMASYIFVMYFGVIDSVTTVLAFLAWELAMAPEIQERLRRECDSLASSTNEATHQDIQGLKYLDMVLSEVLRKWPGAIATDRLVTKSYTIEPELPHEKPVHLKEGDNIMIPIYALHRDAKYFPEPEKFDPERFSPQRKHEMNSNAYIPFGIGPRHCFGTKFSTILMKQIFYKLMLSFEIVPVENTKRKLEMDKSALSLYPVGGFKLGLKRRK
ncbi:cytochrome P450 9e2-like [Harmonia axyridis]|uniref:cytochrome P450 9e2-like n=1 Tax=Harmonia axyridis TaxID=115357 RepID=UPI001E27648C|nr:cytochrome P450 9e2-like [Harmonia axyridis]XP_045476174.1 cytochrome P450 9e2-like [Harmonia axyridis]XP_045476175.1 cytochrome P450 9e2-like [Harmonia axyridis]XP_045476176.1 cytochrome P450 9e2-like [Harmonia axyridis]